MGDVMLNDMELLRDYAMEGSEESFRTLLDRHVGLVYSAALRQVRDAPLAEEITQAVFVVLARKAGSIRRGTILAGWLFRTTRFIAARAARDEQRRRHREREAANMESFHPVLTQGMRPSFDGRTKGNHENYALSLAGSLHCLAHRRTSHYGTNTRFRNSARQWLDQTSSGGGL
jgi:DNA-directed RNA polymerase specialized sigma24 family protein